MNARTFFVLVFLALVTHAQGAAAQGGFEGGLRLGYAVPLGEISDGDDLNDGISGQIPLWLDLGYRLDRHWFIGVYAQYGFGFAGGVIDDACDAADAFADVSCTASDIRLGIQAHYHFLNAASSLDPWLGVGLGYEWLSFGVDGNNAEVTITGSGFEFLNLQFGLDFKAAEHLVFGPFVSFSLGQYGDVSVDCSSPIGGCGGFSDYEIDDKALHEWLLLGLRGAYTP